MSDPFEILGLPDTASLEELKARWQVLASEHHPDKGGDAERFNIYRQAYKAAHQRASEPELCSTCNGVGKITVVRGFHQVKLPCPDCWKLIP